MGRHYWGGSILGIIDSSGLGGSSMYRLALNVLLRDYMKSGTPSLYKEICSILSPLIYRMSKGFRCRHHKAHCHVVSSAEAWTPHTVAANATNDCQAFGTGNGQRPKCHHHQMQRALRRPCKISAICETIWLHPSHHRSRPDVAIGSVCSRSSSTASPKSCLGKG